MSQVKGKDRRSTPRRVLDIVAGPPNENENFLLPYPFKKKKKSQIKIKSGENPPEKGGKGK